MSRVMSCLNCMVVVKWVARFIVHYELQPYEPFGRLIANDMGDE